MKQFLARSLSPQNRAENGGSATPPRAPADYLEQCRREFINRYFQQVSGDDYEFSPNVYED